LLTLSRLSPEKQVERVLDALRRIERDDPARAGKLALIVAGAPAYMGGDRYDEQLRRQAAQLDRVQVRFSGYVAGEAKWALFAAADLFCSPPHYEAYGLTIAQALASGAPPKFVLWLMLRLHPAIRAQRKKADAAFAGKIWRGDLRRWDDEAKPRSNQRHLELGSVYLAALSNEELADHVDACLAQWKEMSHQHAYFSVSAMLPLGDFLNQVSAWSGRSLESLLPIFQGESPSSSGWIPQADPLLAAIAADQAASELLAGDSSPDAVLAGLAENSTIGPLLDVYLKVIEPRVIGYDIADRTARETPGLLLDGLRALRTRDEAAARAAGDRHAAEAREAVPVEHRANFDDLLQEARSTYRLRDERGLFSDSVAGRPLARRYPRSGPPRRGVRHPARRRTRRRGRCRRVAAPGRRRRRPGRRASRTLRIPHLAHHR